MMRVVWVTAVVFALVSPWVAADDKSHTYVDGEKVTLWVNKVGPYHNPQETYDYYDLPFCQPKGAQVNKHKQDSLGAQLEGNDLHDSGISLSFKLPEAKRAICKMDITAERIKEFTSAVEQHYWYQMYIDELPLWGMVGDDTEQEDGKSQAFLYTHKELTVAFNGNQIIEVDLTSTNPQPLVLGQTHEMTYSVSWVPTTKSFADRFDRYLDFDFFEHQIHWFSIFNCFMIVIFLCGLVVFILTRTLKHDYARYTTEDDDLELDRVVDESGWKQVHGDVFRKPGHLVLFSALVGTGYQLTTLAFCIISLTLMGTFYDERGAMVTTFLVCYSLTSFWAGYGGSATYKKYGGRAWKKAMLLTAVLLPWTCFALFFFLNFIAMYYESQATIEFEHMLIMVAIWTLVECPLVVLGTLVGRSTTVAGDFPCRVNSLRRPIPNNKWYATPLGLAAVAGVLPFGSIFIEMYFIFSSFWNYKFYYVYGFMFLVFVILLIVVVCVTIVSIYLLLNGEDYRWIWTSFACGGSTAVYVFLYAIYYYSEKTQMTGAMQTSFYFGYMGLMSLIMYIMCGTVGYLGAGAFVYRIYNNIKSD